MRFRNKPRFMFHIHWQEALLIALFGLTMVNTDARAAELHGRVVGVTDGDTITVLDSDNEQHTVRLFAIDAPEISCHQHKPSAKADACVERGQPFGKAAKRNLSDLVFNRQVVVVLQDGRTYGREIGTVMVGDVDANLSQVRSGYAWFWRKYAKRGMNQSTYQAYGNAESDAKNNRVGLWGDANPVPPWEYRHR